MLIPFLKILSILSKNNCRSDIERRGRFRDLREPGTQEKKGLIELVRFSEWCELSRSNPKV